MIAYLMNLNPLSEMYEGIGKLWFLFLARRIRLSEVNVRSKTSDTTMAYTVFTRMIERSDATKRRTNPPRVINEAER